MKNRSLRLSLQEKFENFTMEHILLLSILLIYKAQKKIFKQHRNIYFELTSIHTNPFNNGVHLPDESCGSLSRCSEIRRRSFVRFEQFESFQENRYAKSRERTIRDLYLLFDHFNYRSNRYVTIC